MSGKATFSLTLMCGNRRYCWKTKPRLRFCGANRVTSRPPTVMVPESGSQNPAIIIKVVVLPEAHSNQRLVTADSFFSHQSMSASKPSS